MYATQGGVSGSTVWARIEIRDASGNTVDTLYINQGDQKTSTIAGLTVKVTFVRYAQDNTNLGTDLVVGPVNAVEKSYVTTCDVSGTGSSDYKFPRESDWCIQVSGFATSGYINSTAGDKLQVVYKPTSTPKYFKMDPNNVVIFKLPNNQGEIGFEGWNYNTWTTLTMTTTQTTIFNTTGSVFASGVSGIQIAATSGGSPISSIVDSSTNTAYQRAFIGFNTTHNTSFGPVIVAFYDTSDSRWEIPTQPASGGSNSYYKPITITGANAANATFSYNFTISHGGGAAVADQQFLFANVSVIESAAQHQVGSGVATPVSMFRAFALGPSTLSNATRINWVNKTSTWSTTSVPDFRLYSGDTAETDDVQVISTATGGPIATNTGTPARIGTSSQDVVTDGGQIVVAPNSNSAGNQVVINVPAQALKVKAYVGKAGGVVSGGTGGTTYTVLKITQAVAKLDSEVTATDRSNNDMVLVGGPCVNTLVADLNSAAKFPYSCGNWPGRNFGRIQAIADAFTSGKTAFVIAGTRAEDTTLATRIAQTGYPGATDSQKAASSTEVTGTVSSPVYS